MCLQVVINCCSEILCDLQSQHLMKGKHKLRCNNEHNSKDLTILWTTAKQFSCAIGFLVFDTNTQMRKRKFGNPVSSWTSKN